MRLNQIVKACNQECCPDIEKEIIPRIIQSDDLHEARLNPFRKANFFFEQLLAIEAKDGLMIYHDGEFEICEAKIDYYRKPKEIHAPSLEDCGGDHYYDYCGRIINKDQDFEVSTTYAANDVVSIAVLMASRDVSDYQGFQAQLNLILSAQELHK